LEVTKSGKVKYYFHTISFGNGTGYEVKKDWEITPKEASGLLRGLVQDGVLELQDAPTGQETDHSFSVSYGRWKLSGTPKAMPRSIMARLQPYLHKAHPDLWKKGP
jgi:hypothetical protein